MIFSFPLFVIEASSLNTSVNIGSQENESQNLFISVYEMIDVARVAKENFQLAQAEELREIRKNDKIKFAEELVQRSQESKPALLGTYQLTAYCACQKCCGKSNGVTASGTQATQGRTVACNNLAFGTRIMINGHEYVVEDRGGMDNNVIDIFFDSHSEALSFGRKSCEVYLIN